MPGVAAAGIYAQYFDSVIKMAKRPGGVSRPEIMQDLAVTRPAANRLIDACRLKHARTEGNTAFFTPTKATNKVLGSGTEFADKSATADTGKDSSDMVNQQPVMDEKTLLTALVGDEPVNRLPQQKPMKTKDQLNIEIDALKKAIDEAEEKAKNGHKTYVVQTAHANALGSKLQRALEARLELEL